MGSLRIQSGQWYTVGVQDAPLASQSACSLTFFVRPNVLLPANTHLFRMPTAGGVLNTFTTNTPGEIQLNFAGQSNVLTGYLEYGVGATYFIALSYNAAGTQGWYANGSSIALAARTDCGNSATPTGGFRIGWGDVGATDFNVADVALWAGHALTAQEQYDLAHRNFTPDTLGVPATAWWTLSGTTSATADPVNDAGFKNAISGGGTFNFGAATISGGTATYAAGTLAFTESILVEARVPKTGHSVYIFAKSNTKNGYEPITAVAGTPTVYKGGAAQTLDPHLGVYWNDGSGGPKTLPFAIARLVNPVLSSDTITLDVPDGFLSTASGSSLRKTALAVTNYTGTIEPDMVPGSYAAIHGVNPGHPVTQNYSAFAFTKNLAKRCIFNWGLNGSSSGSVVVNSDGSLASFPAGQVATSWFWQGVSNAIDTYFYPIPVGPSIVVTGGSGTGFVGVATVVGGVIQSIQVVSGGSGYTSPVVHILEGGGFGATATATLSGGAIASVAVTAGGSRYSDGLYKTMWDDIHPASPTTAAVGSWSGHAIVTPVVVAGVTSAGTLVSGTQVGVTRCWYVQTRMDAATLRPLDDREARLQLEVTGGQVSGGTATNGATNLWCFRPDTAPDRSDPLAMDPFWLDWIRSGGKGPKALRWMEPMNFYGGNATMVASADMLDPAKFSWNDRGDAHTRSAVISAVRNYNLTDSPHVYLWDGTHPNAVTSNNLAVAPYMINPSSVGWYNLYGTSSGRAFLAELVTSAAHGLKTGTWIEMETRDPVQTFPCSNGGGSPVQVQVNGQSQTFQFPIFVTSATTFVILNPFTAAISDGSGVGQPGDINNIVGSTAASPTWHVYNDTPYIAAIPAEAVFAAHLAMPDPTATVPWICLPPACDDSYVDAIVDLFTSLMPAGSTLALELGNELWNGGLSSEGYRHACINYASGMGRLFSPTPTYANYNSRVHWQVHRSGQIFTRAAARIAAAGKGQHLKRLVASWTSANITPSVVAAANNLGVAFDWLPIDTYLDALDDQPMRDAWASYASGYSGSPQFGAANPWTMPELLEWLRHAIVYRTDYNGPGTGGLPTGLYASHKAALADYTAGGPIPELVAYEGGIETAVPASAGPSGYFLTLLTHDAQHHPDYYYAYRAYLQSIQAAGFACNCIFFLADIRGSGGTFVWGMGTHGAQHAGRGDGSGGGAVNRFGFATNSQSLGNDGISHDVDNDSPALLAFRDWVAASDATPTSNATLNVTERPDGVTGSAGTATAASLHVTERPDVLVAHDAPTPTPTATAAPAKWFPGMTRTRMRLRAR